MSLAKAVSVLIALEAELVAEEILEANEGFDGEITAEELAIRVCKQMAEHKWHRRGREEINSIIRAATPVAPARVTRAEATGGAATNPHLAARAARGRGRQPKTCNRCGESNLKWGKHEGRWTLYHEDGTAHRCGRPAPTATPASEPATPVKAEPKDFMSALKAVGNE